MDEIDDLWEIEAFGAYAYWVSETMYEMVKKLLMDVTIDKTQTGISFTTIHGMEYVFLLSNISNITHSTREMRVAARTMKKEYAKEYEEKKEAWEE